MPFLVFHAYSHIRIGTYHADFTYFLSLFLSGFHWYLFGLSDLPLEQRLLLFLAGETFLFIFIFSILSEKKGLVLWRVLFVGLPSCFLYVQACYRASTAKLNTAQHSAISRAQKQQMITRKRGPMTARECKRECKRADRSWRQPACRRAFCTARCVLKTNEEK